MKIILIALLQKYISDGNWDYIIIIIIIIKWIYIHSFACGLEQSKKT